MDETQKQTLAKEIQDALCEALPNVVIDIKGCQMLVGIIERISPASK
jgi:hypothetical protein